MKNRQEIEQLPPHPGVEELEKYRLRLKKLIGFKKIALSKAVEGRLRISSTHGVRQFYQVLDKTNFAGKYIPRENLKLVKQLAQKSYDRRSVSKMVKLEKLIRKFCQDFEKLVPENIYKNMTDDRKVFVDPMILPDESYAKLWKSEEYYKKPFWVGEKEYYAASGLRVRSKSEILIADTLDRYGIPYRYEFPVELKRIGTVHPDFYVLRLSDRKEFCWEHFGMMDDSGYKENAVGKIAAYGESGWFPGHNMIVTFESADCPLEERRLERMIERLLL